MAAARDAVLLAGILLFVGAAALEAAEQPEAETKYGRVRGYQFEVDAAERTVNVFLGLPFAKPPVGSLRFSEPQPPEPWQDVRDATAYPPMCLQDKAQGQTFSDVITNRKDKVLLQVSEDCLYLNVYTPVPTGKQEKLPVLVWIHGGGLVFGAASSYDGSALAAFDNVVVVAIQYRLGIAGYFSTGDEHARGNWGYLDQVAALQWIQENIIHFGGDPGSVTIFGESAGGISVSALVLSPLAKGLFHKAISESGTVALGLFTDNPKEDAQKIAAVAGCEKSSSAAMVECLRGKTEEELLQVTLKMDSTTLQLCSNASPGECKQVSALPFCTHLELPVVYCHALPGQGKENGTDDSGEPQNQIIYYVLLKSSYHNAYVPLKFPSRNCFFPTLPRIHGLIEVTKDDFFFVSACVDGAFFPKSPKELLSEKSISAVPYIIGVNNCEFGWGLPMIMKYPPFVDGLDKDVARQILKANLALIIQGPVSEIADRVYKEYIADAESPAQVRDGLLDAMGDLYFVISSVEVARYHRDAGNPVYFYEFQHRASSLDGLVPEFVKADHGAEIAFVFGKPFLAGGATKEEDKLSRTVMRYWTNFAKNGNPNGEGLVHWPQYGLEEKYLGIDLEQKVAEKLKEHRVEFWAQLKKQIQNGRINHTDL